MHDTVPDLTPPTRPYSAVAMSLVFHVILLTLIGLVWSQSPHGSGEIADRPVGIAIVHRMPDRDRYVDTAEVAMAETDAANESQASTAAAAAPPADLSPPIDLAGVLQAMQSIPTANSATGLAGETDLQGDAFGSDRGDRSSPDTGDATTMVFGVSGSGSRFVYVFDRSDSMNGYGGRPLRAAKAEMIRSLRSLTDRQRFQLIFYNDKPTPFRMPGVPLQLMAGESSIVTLAERYIDSIAAYGGTEHDAALKMALRMSPDVIFFLTDARIPRLSRAQLGEIQNRAERSGTTIHAIEFGPDPIVPRDSFLRELAAMNHGQYQYVDVQNLKANRSEQAASRDE